MTAKESLHWSHEQRRLDQLTPWEHNPRAIGGKQYSELKRSMTEFGTAEPVVINTDNTIVGGHARFEAAKELGWQTIDVWVPNRKLAPKEFEALNLRLNKNIAGEWDNALLAEFEQDMLADVGFDDDELDKIFERRDEDDFDADAAASAIETPMAQPGDIYQLGEHRLMCGDATKVEDLRKLMGGVEADLVFTDPPYNVNYSGRGKNTSNKIEGDHQSESDFRQFLTDTFAAAKQVMKADAALYTCYASRTHREFEDALNANGFEVRNQIIWVKKVASMGWGDYRWKHEPILYCKQEGKPAKFYGDRSQYTEWYEEPTDEEILKHARRMMTKDEQGGSTVWRLNREQKYDHPTQKPVKLYQIGMRNSTKRGDVILDPFGGSGSAMIAAEGVNRRAYMLEMDPKYVDVIVARWEQHSDQKAEKLT